MSSTRDYRSREQIIDDAVNRSYIVSRNDPTKLNYKNRLDGLAGSIHANLKAREAEIDAVHARMIESPSEKTSERWTYYQTRLRDLRSR